MYKSLCDEFRRYQGQPVDIFTDDHRHRRGIVLYSMDDGVRIIDDCGCIVLIEFKHITFVEEPQMSLRKCRRHGHCDDYEGRGDGEFNDCD